MNVICEMSQPFVANVAVDGATGQLLRSHVKNCLRCRSRQATMSKAARELRAMATATERAPLDLQWRVMSALGDDAGVVRSWRRPLALAAAVASLAAAWVIWKMRPRTS